MFILNGNEFDIYAPQVVGENQYPAGWFHDAAARAAASIIEIDGTPPAVGPTQRAVRGAITETAGAWSLHWSVVDLTSDEIHARDEAAATALAAAVAALVAQIDIDVDAIYAAIVGNRLAEYNDAAADAAAYKAAGYSGAAPAGVQSWADAKGWTARQSADDILAAAARLTALRDTIRAQRLAKKEQARAATDAAGVNAAIVAWAGALVAIRTAAGI
jgi:hypothetical protein